MSYGVTPTGFVRPTLAELKAELDTQARIIWPGIDVDGDGKYGQLIGLWCKALSDAWDVAQETYTMLNRNEATGASLDNLLSTVGVVRIDAAPTTIYGALLWGDNGTLVSAGSKVMQSSSKKMASLLSNVTISISNARAARFELATPSGSTTWTVTLNGTAYTYTGTVKDTAGSSLVSAINGGTLGATASYSGGVLTVDGTVGISDSVNFAISTLINTTIVKGGLASAGTFVADDEGPLPFPIGTIDTILTPVSGWATVSNPIDGQTGRNAETDAELRARASTFYSTGKATEEAIRQYILNSVTGVVACAVTSNRTGTTDGDGRPGHSFEVLVEGGDPDDIAEAIWATAPAGIEIHGTTTRTVTDSEGRTQTVKFSRPSYYYIWVKVQRAFNSEETYPVDGDLRIKQAIVDWALANFNSGENVYRRAIMTPVNMVPGLGDVIILLGNTTNGTTPSAYNASDIAVPATTIALFSVDRITVEAHP